MARVATNPFGTGDRTRAAPARCPRNLQITGLMHCNKKSRVHIVHAARLQPLRLLEQRRFPLPRRTESARPARDLPIPRRSVAAPKEWQTFRLLILQSSHETRSFDRPIGALPVRRRWAQPSRSRSSLPGLAFPDLPSRVSAEMSLASRSTSVMRPRLPPSMPISFMRLSIMGAWTR